MERESASQLLHELRTFRQVRGDDWQGVDARGGARLSAAEAGVPSAQGGEDEIAVPSSAQAMKKAGGEESRSIWSVIEEAVGGGQSGKVVARLMQKYLLERVDRLAIDEVELMAGGAVISGASNGGMK